MATDKKKRLRTGFTTGAAAAAAVKAALIALVENRIPESVSIRFLTGESAFIAVHRCHVDGTDQATALIIKDAGDDPDVTHKAEVGAVVELIRNGDNGDVTILGGNGVGIVTKPGLEVPPGQPAINSGPRKMIRQSVKEVLSRNRIQAGVRVTVFIPKGEQLAQKTLNPRLGIVGGLSVLGTTGIERPMSHEAYTATILSALSVAAAAGHHQVVLTTGRRSERHAQALWPELAEDAFIQMGDFFKFTMEAASDGRFNQIWLAVFFGKAIKIAQGVPHTHAAKSVLALETLARWTLQLTGEKEFAQSIQNVNTARHAFDLFRQYHPGMISFVGRQMLASARAFSRPGMGIGAVIFDYDGNMVFRQQEIA